METGTQGIQIALVKQVLQTGPEILTTEAELMK